MANSSDVSFDYTSSGVGMTDTSMATSTSSSGRAGKRSLVMRGARSQTPSSQSGGDEELVVRRKPVRAETPAPYGASGKGRGTNAMATPGSPGGGQSSRQVGGVSAIADRLSIYRLALMNQENEATMTLKIIEEHRVQSESDGASAEQHWQARARAFETEACEQHQYAEYYAKAAVAVGTRATEELRERDAKCAYYECATETLQHQMNRLYAENRAVVTEANERITADAQHFAKGEGEINKLRAELLEAQKVFSDQETCMGELQRLKGSIPNAEMRYDSLEKQVAVLNEASGDQKRRKCETRLRSQAGC